MSGDSYEIVAQCRDRLGESPMWSQEEQALYWIDWYGAVVHRFKPANCRLDHWNIPATEAMGSLVLSAGGRLVIAIEPGLLVFDPQSGVGTLWIDPNGQREGVGYNDAKIDSGGNLWLGTFDVAEREPRGILYRIAPDGSWAVGDSGFVVCNGPAFTPDGRTLYFSDSMGRQILAYDLDSVSGKLSNRRTFARFGADDGLPDGLTVDSAGQVWCALYGAGRICCLGPDGAMRRELTLPCAAVTSCCFGGASLTRLFVTTGVSDHSDPEVGGGVFAFDLETPGLAEPRFTPEPFQRN